MGFEQLASLKEELAKEAVAKQKRRTRPEEKAASKAAVDPVVRTIGLLQKHFPQAFPKRPSPKVPLKIGIHKDLLELAEKLGLSQNEIRAAIKKWCKGKRYSECLVAGAARVDLQGQEAGQVSKEEAAQADKVRANFQQAAPA